MTKRTSQEAYALRLVVDVFINKKLILTNAIMPALRVKKKASSIVGALSIGLSVPGLWLYRKRPRV
ncbi:hypothetical protein CYS22_05245 [Salmonella enterica subsp. enterica serovar Virchow]|nr:hypothetical protein [Salmonella enterica subsp. enterica serovar Virchow]